MNYGNTLKQIRKSRGMTQVELYGNRSKASKIEKQLQDLKITDLTPLLDKLDITLDEFFSYSDTMILSSSFNKKLDLLAEGEGTDNDKKLILERYKILSSKKVNTFSSKDFSFYLGVKIKLTSKYDFIHPVTNEEIAQAFYRLKTNKHFFFYDYLLAVNTSLFLDIEQIEILISKMYPLSDISSQHKETNIAGTQLYINALNIYLYEQEYKTCLNLINKFPQMIPDSPNYYHSLNLQYLYNLAKYKITNNKMYYDNISSFIALLKDIGDKNKAEVFSEESYSVIYHPETLKRQGADSISNNISIDL